eukprot:Ihof_evm2s668 gene=Ihof_evmTU2s668
MMKQNKYQIIPSERPPTAPPPPAYPPSRKVNATGGRFVALPSNVATEVGPDEQPLKGRVTVYCTAGAYDKRALRDYLENKQQRCGGTPPKLYQDVLYVEYEDMYDHQDQVPEEEDELRKEVFYFDYGVLVMWAMTVKQEEE